MEINNKLWTIFGGSLSEGEKSADVAVRGAFHGNSGDFEIWLLNRDADYMMEKRWTINVIDEKVTTHKRGIFADNRKL